MSTSPDGPSLQSPEDYAAYLRARAEEAISASVHHASLSQQYLTLSQKFSALAEQAASGVPVARSVHQLEREASTGSPADPIGAPQIAAAITGRPASSVPRATLASVSTPGTSGPNGIVGDQAQAMAAELNPGIQAEAPRGEALFSPPARMSPPLPEIVGQGALSGIDATTGDTGRSLSPQPEGTTSSVVNSRKPVARKNRKKKLSIRSLLERARLAAIEQAERVRVRVRKSDLKPQLRTTTQEVKEEIKRGGVPAMISTVVTVLALLILALQQLEYVESQEMPALVAGFSSKIEPVEESLPIEPPAEEVGEQMQQPTEEMPAEPEPEEPEPVMEPEPTPEPPPEPALEMTPDVPMADVALPETPNGTIPASPVAMSGDATGAVDNRSAAGRKVMLEKFGGSAASESAVGYALEWLAARQRSDGSWDFIDVGPCANPGTINNPIGGTAYALLPFLAAGQTHKEGQYKKQVQAGLQYLMSVGVSAPAGYDLRGVVNLTDKDKEPNYAYYVHGAATLAMCEAYGMTKDRKLKPAAEGAVSFLLNSQDPRGGGWRYNPQQPGSTSATTIQVMALKAAEKAGIKIPEATWKGVTFYLDSVAVDKAGRYGYEVEKKSYQISVTSMALLSRMYLGWGRDDGDLRAGVALIDKRGPYDNLYYNYFATQVMKNWGGKEWDRWNGRLRDDLISWQEKGDSEVAGDDGRKSSANPARGSWTPRDRDDYSKAGGRLLTTCLATLTLEVYYRYKPLLPEATETPSASAD